MALTTGSLIRTWAGAALLSAATVLPGAAYAQGEAGAAPDYDDSSVWLCRPGREDACAVDLDAAVVQPDGSVTMDIHQPAQDPAIDCFYVYPTVSVDPGVNSDLEIGPEERGVVHAQFARFSEVCRPFAPLYRQVTLTALRAAMAGDGDAMSGGALAYGDVREAWRHYLENDNDGRGVILVGHSQGARMLQTLINQEIEGEPIQDQVISAYLIGWNVQVPEGETVGGDFNAMPICTEAGQTGCVVSYVTFRDDVPPPANTRFGRSPDPANQIACVNPASLSGDGPVMLDAYLSNGSDGYDMASQSWTETQDVDARFVKLPDFLSGQCVNRDGAQYLSVTVNADPSDPRTDVLTGDVIANGQVLADWGLHLVDMHVVMGDLIDLAETQADAYQNR